MQLDEEEEEEEGNELTAFVAPSLTVATAPSGIAITDNGVKTVEGLSCMCVFIEGEERKKSECV